MKRIKVKADGSYELYMTDTGRPVTYIGYAGYGKLCAAFGIPKYPQLPVGEYNVEQACAKIKELLQQG